ncbi:U3 small nucleolar RNA-associated protein [Tulasnella sp. 330]|nr:U3 small nucleolar RNA-associated protein [Tulasnella sp. 330]KAG8870584.1 U3 small nucleolar RNA-associated protein [Tulasnella sp. 331]
MVLEDPIEAQPSKIQFPSSEQLNTSAPSRLKLRIHRSRFIEWAPGAITAIAFPPSPPPTPSTGKAAQNFSLSWFGTLAIGRANGNIELYEWSEKPEEQSFAPQAWVLRKVFPGPLDSKVDSLVFAYRDPKRFFRSSLKSQSKHKKEPAPTLMDLRMFSSGGGTDIVEWDLCTGSILRTYPVNGGSVWCLAINPANTLLAAGCDDGGVQVLALTDDIRGMEWHKRMDSGKGKVLSVAWGPPTLSSHSTPRRTNLTAGTRANTRVGEDTSDSESSSASDDNEEEPEPEWQDSWLVGGCSDSRLRRWDFNSRRVVAQLLTDKLRGIQKTLVWAVGVLRDGTIVSGDSMGLVNFWDVKTSTQFKSIRAHDADVLCLAISSDGSSVFSSGVDQKVTQCILSQTTASSLEDSIIPPPMDWIKAFSKRLHAHDVRALAIWPPCSLFPDSSHQHHQTITINPGIAPILASGGQDMVAGLTPCSTPFGASIKRRVMNPLAINAREALSRTTVFEEGVWQRMAYPLAQEVVWVATKAMVKGKMRFGNEAPVRRLVVGRSDVGVKVWSLKGPKEKRLGGYKDDDDDDDDEGEGDQTSSPVLEMELNVGTNLVCGSVSEDGRWLAVSDGLEVKLFRLGELFEDGSFKDPPRRIKNVSSSILSALPPSSSSSSTAHQPSAAASKLTFTPDSTRLIVACSPSAHIVVLDLSLVPSPSNSDVRVLRVFQQHAEDDEEISGRTVKSLPSNSMKIRRDERGDRRDKQKGSRTIIAMCLSHDGQWLASADERGRVHVFNLDSMQHHTTLPTFPLPTHALAFDPNPGCTSHLILAQPNNVLSIFDVEARLFPRWAQELFGGEEQDRRSRHGHRNRTTEGKDAFRALKPGVEGLVFVKGPMIGEDKNKKERAKMTRRERNESMAVSGPGMDDKVVRYHLLAWGWNWICHIDITPPPLPPSPTNIRRHDHDYDHDGSSFQADTDPYRFANAHPSSPSNFKTIMTYRQLLYVGDLNADTDERRHHQEGEILVVERPLTDVLMSEGMPPPFYKPRYGRS